MYTYKNKKNGNVITTHGKVTGDSWELVRTDKKRNQAKAEKPKNDEGKEPEETQEEQG